MRRNGRCWGARTVEKFEKKKIFHRRVCSVRLRVRVRMPVYVRMRVGERLGGGWWGAGG